MLDPSDASVNELKLNNLESSGGFPIWKPNETDSFEIASVLLGFTVCHCSSLELRRVPLLIDQATLERFDEDCIHGHISARYG